MAVKEAVLVELTRKRNPVIGKFGKLAALLDVIGITNGLVLELGILSAFILVHVGI